MWEKLVVEEEPGVEDSTLVVALSTMAPQYEPLYSHARELSRFLLRKLEFRKFATLYSSSLPADVAIGDDGVVAPALQQLLFLLGEEASDHAGRGRLPLRRPAGVRPQRAIVRSTARGGGGGVRRREVVRVPRPRRGPPEARRVRIGRGRREGARGAGSDDNQGRAGAVLPQPRRGDGRRLRDEGVQGRGRPRRAPPAPSVAAPDTRRPLEDAGLIESTPRSCWRAPRSWRKRARRQHSQMSAASAAAFMGRPYLANL